jgi:hypothetical protein
MNNNFNPGVDREKEAFLALANRGNGLSPINYIYAEDISCENILSSSITGGTAELYTIYTSGIYSDNITNSEDIITNRLKWSNPFNDHYVGFIAGNSTQNTIWRLPLQDGTDGQVISTNGNGILSFIDAGGIVIPNDATYILQTPNEQLPNAQALNQLDDGLMKNNKGVIQIAISGEDYLNPNLPSGQLWIGNENNIATPEPIITIDNLPNLGMIVPTIGQIWEGTASGRPKVSDSLATLYATLIATKFILKTKPLLFPLSQGLDDLPACSILYTDQFKEGDLLSVVLLQNQILMGGLNNIPEARTTIGLYNLPNLSFNKLWLGDENNRPVEYDISTVILPDLRMNYLWIGDANNKPAEQLTISINNLPNLRTSIVHLGKGKIWRGTLLGRPVESDDLSSLEIAFAEFKDVRFPAEIALLEVEIDAAVALLEFELAEAVIDLELEIAAAVATAVALLELEIKEAVTNLEKQINNLRLNKILADNNVSFYNYKLINLADPVNPTDGVNLRTLNAAITGSTGVTYLEGFVIGGPPVNDTITTERGPTCLLTNIPAGGDVSMDNYRIKNLQQSPTENFDAISTQFLWDLMHDEVEVIWPQVV